VKEGKIALRLGEEREGKERRTLVMISRNNPGRGLLR